MSNAVGGNSNSAAAAAAGGGRLLPMNRDAKVVLDPKVRRA